MTKAMLLFLVTSIALALASLHLVRELRAERANVQSLLARVSELETPAAQPASAAPMPFATWSARKMAPAPARTPRNSPDNQPPAAALHAPAGSLPAPNAQPNEERVRRMREYKERMGELNRDPEYREALRMQQRMSLVRANPDLAAELGLTQQQADEFFSLMAEHALHNMDSAEALMLDPAADQAAQEETYRRSLETQQAQETELAQLLGPQKFKAWKEYQSTLHGRHQAKELTQLLASSGVPLEPERTKSLIKILAQEQERTLLEAQRQMELASRADAEQNRVTLADRWDDRHLDRMAEQNRRTREALSSVLSAEQLDIYTKDRDAHLQMQRAQWRVMKMQSQAPGNAAFRDWAAVAPMMMGETVMYASPAVRVAVPAPSED